MTPSTPKAPVAGIAEGIQFVRLGKAKEGEFQLSGNAILLGPRGDLSAADVIVIPQPGYEFLYDIKNLNYQVVKKLGSFDANGTFIPQPETIKSTLTFMVSNSSDQDRVNKWLELAKQLPGFTSLT